MALQRKTLKAMGLTDEQIDSIIDMHSETVDGLKAQISAAKATAATPAQETGKQETTADEQPKEDYKAKYEAEKAKYESYKKEIEEKQAKQAKEKAVRAYFEGKSITGKNLEIAMRGAKAEIEAVEMDGEKIKDTRALDNLVSGDYAPLIVTTTTTGAQTATPPAASGSTKFKDKSEILSIKDGAERRKAIAENPELFGVKTFEK